MVYLILCVYRLFLSITLTAYAKQARISASSRSSNSFKIFFIHGFGWFNSLPYRQLQFAGKASFSLLGSEKQLLQTKVRGTDNHALGRQV